MLDSFIHNLSGALRPALLFSSVILFIAGLYASGKTTGRVAIALFSLVIAIVLLSVLLVKPRPLSEQPFPDSHETADATRQLVSGNGYVTYVHGNEPRPPRYAPGFSLALAPFAIVGDDYPSNVQRGAAFYAALYVLAAVVAAWSLTGPIAGALIAILIGLSPFATVSASIIMSDAFAAGVTVLFIALLRNPTPKRISLIGVLAGALVAVRLPMILNLIALSIALPWVFRLRLLLYSAPPLAAMGVYNWLTFGSPLTTGYNYWFPGEKFFRLSSAFSHWGDGPWVVGDVLHGLLLNWVCPCPQGGPQAALDSIYFYPALLIGLFWIYTPPFLPILGLLHGWATRHKPAGKFTLWLIALSLVFFTFYYYQGARFMAAPATLLGVFAAAKIAQWIEERLIVVAR